MTKSKETVAYFAGLLDGEGYISLVKASQISKVYVQLAVKISMVDESRVLDEASSLWGGKVSDIKARSEKHRDVRHWAIFGKTAEMFLSDVYPYLRVKKDQATLALEFRKHVSFNNNVTENVRKYRFHLYDGMKGLHHSIPFTIDKELKKKAEKDIKTKRFMPVELKQRLSEIAKANKNHPGRFKKGQASWNKGKKTSSVENVCGKCGKTFLVQKWKHKHGRGKFCSWNCRKNI